MGSEQKTAHGKLNFPDSNSHGKGSLIFRRFVSLVIAKESIPTH